MSDEIVYCTNCGSANDLGTKFCFKCGTPIKTIAKGEVKGSSDFITLACPKCGGKLEITPDMDRFECRYCGNEHIVKRNGYDISLTPVVEGIKRVEQKFDHVLSGSDRMAAEQTITRLKDEIANLETSCQKIQSEYDSMQSAMKKAPGNGLRIIGLILLPIFFLVIWAAGSLYDSAYTDFQYYFSIILFVIGFGCLLAGIICIIVGSERFSKYRQSIRTQENDHLKEKKLAELEQAQTQLADHKKRLEDLHRYTTER